MIGAPGTGKRYIAKTIAHAAIQSFAKNRLSQGPCVFSASNILDGFVKSPRPVTPAKAGVHNIPKKLDCGLRRNDNNGCFSTFYEFVILDRYSKRKSTIVTSNRPIEDWGRLLKDNAASS